MTVLDMGGKHVVVDGNIIERDTLYIAERLIEINPNLVILATDPQRTDSLGEEPWLICETCPDGRVRKIFGCWQLDESVITRVQLADTYGRDILGDLEKQEQKAKEAKEKAFKERVEQANEIAYKILQTNKSKYTFTDPFNGDTVIVHDDKPSERIKEK